MALFQDAPGTMPDPADSWQETGRTCPVSRFHQGSERSTDRRREPPSWPSFLNSASMSPYASLDTRETAAETSGSRLHDVGHPQPTTPDSTTRQLSTFPSVGPRRRSDR